MRGGLSSQDLQKAWRYAVQTDFHGLTSGENDPIETVTLTYDSHERFIPFQRRNDRMEQAYGISSDERWLAHGVDMTIDLYDLSTGKRVTTLSGHTASIGSLAFAPNHSNTLLSSAASRGNRAEDERAEIIVWNLREISEGSTETERAEPDDVAREAVEHIQTRLAAAAPPVSLESGETAELTTTLEKLLDRFISRSSLPSTARRLSGRLCTSFQSPVFNNAGTAFTVLPARSPPSNGDAQWDIGVHDLGSGRETILTGHRDSIMWIGFSPDDSLIVSACWDGTFRVWRADTGEQVHIWTTDKQNWTGCFAPDNDRFLGTDGDGKIRVWSLSSGELLWSYEGAGMGRAWRRFVDWSRDGKYILVGGEDLGEILLFEVPPDPSVGPPEAAQRRVLSLEKTRMDDDVKRMARGFLSVNSLRFIFDVEDNDVTFGCSTYIDVGIEFVSLARGKRWRIIPFERTDDDEADYKRLDRTKEGWPIYPRWSALKKSRQVVVISPDGARFWKLT